MKRCWLGVLVGLMVLSAQAVLVARDLPEAVARKVRGDVRDLEDEVIGLARYCSKEKSYSSAADVLQLGLKLVPGSSKIEKELEKAEGKEDRPKSRFEKAFPKKRAEFDESCTRILVKIAKACWGAEENASFYDYVELLSAHFDIGPVRSDLDLDWFEPYYRWFHLEDCQKLEKGWESIDGKWRDPDEVTSLNAEHSTWDSPWRIDDGVHEVQTCMEYRTAQRTLRLIGVFRAYFLCQFESDWELVEPDGLLPVIVTKTQDEHAERFKAVAGTSLESMGGTVSAAFYLWMNQPLNPCFVTYEPTDATGIRIKVGFEGTRDAIQHEIVHQIAFEYSKKFADDSREPTYQYWVVEAVATFMQYHVYRDGKWTITHPEYVPFGKEITEGAFAYAQKNIDKLPTIKEISQYTTQEVSRAETYHVLATLAYFLMEGEDSSYRESFVKLLQIVHRVQDSTTSFGEAFGEHDLDKLHSAWLEFIRALEIEEDK